MQTLPNGVKKIESSDNVTVENLTRNDELIDEKIGEIGTLSALLTTTKTTVVAAINEVFQSASNLKSKVAAAITGMGQAASADDTADQLAAKISAIATDATAVEGEVLTGRTFYKGVKRTGTMPNHSNGQTTAAGTAVGKYTGDGRTYVYTYPAQGYYDGSTAATRQLAEQFLPENIVDGNNLLGVPGAAIRASGNAAAADLLAGKTASNASGAITGTMVDRGSPTITPGASAVTIPAGRYTGGSVSAVAGLTAANIKDGAVVGGVTGTFSETASGATPAQILGSRVAFVNGVQVTGTMVDRSGDTAAVSSAVSGTTLRLRASEGYRDGTNDYVTITDADFIAANIRSGVNLFGLAGTLVEGKRIATGTVTASGTTSAWNFVLGGTYNLASAEIMHGLGVAPWIVILARKDNVNNYMTFYRSDGFNGLGTASAGPIIISSASDGSYSQNWSATLIGGVSFVSNTTRIVLPTSNWSVAYTWIAIAP